MGVNASSIVKRLLEDDVDSIDAFDPAAYVEGTTDYWTEVARRHGFEVTRVTGQDGEYWNADKDVTISRAPFCLNVGQCMNTPFVLSLGVWEHRARPGQRSRGYVYSFIVLSGDLDNAIPAVEAELAKIKFSTAYGNHDDDIRSAMRRIAPSFETKANAYVKNQRNKNE